MLAGISAFFGILPPLPTQTTVFDIKPHLSADDDQALHESAHHGHVAHGISG